MTASPVLIAPSLLSCDFARLAEECARCLQSGADWLHVDVMDGHFVPNITVGPPVVKKISAAAELPLDVHLMISDPLRYAADFVAAGAHLLSFHIEAVGSVEAARGVLAAARKAGAPEVGIALNPDTPAEQIAGLLGEVDLVLVMSVFPGFGGQAFLPDVLSKVRWLRSEGYRGRIEMDGGLNPETLPRCAAAGADVLVAGSAIFGPDDMRATIEGLRSAALRARAEASHVG